MKLTTVRTDAGTRAARVEGDEYVLLPHASVVDLLADPSYPSVAMPEESAERQSLKSAKLAPTVRPGRTICVGLNYRSHILEMGRSLPEFPTLFAKFPEVLAGPYDDIELPAASDEVDWEAELGVVIGKRTRKINADQALEHIAGYTVVNDVSMRDWQWRTTQWLAGKNFESSTPVGPVLVTPDEVDHARDLSLTCQVDQKVMQQARTSDLLFTPAEVIAYVSQFLTLQPGDLVAMGTPGGVAAGRDTKPFLRDGQTVTVTLEGVGSCVNIFRSGG
jgi:acylpyruvate hydrolase